MDFQYLKNFLDMMAKERTPGNAVEVHIGNKCVFKYAAGYSDLETKTKLTGDEYFNIFSCSKITTMTAVLQLLEKSKILVTDPLYDYIPEYKTMYVKDEDGTIREAKNPITIGNLITMTAGFGYNFKTDAAEKARMLTDGKMNTDVFARCMAQEPLLYDPGEKWRYSLAHDILAGLITIIEGKPFRQYVKENIFEPLGMDKAVYHATDEIKEKMASQYKFVPTGQEGEIDIVAAQQYGKSNDGTFVNIGKGCAHVLGDEFDSGGAGITTTVSDYIKLLEALANFGVGANGERILTSNAVELMRTNALTEKQLEYFNWVQAAGCGYGYGVRTLMNPARAGVIGNIGEIGWGGAAGATALVDSSLNLSAFYVQHCHNPREGFYQPRLRNAIYTSLGR